MAPVIRIIWLLISLIGTICGEFRVVSCPRECKCSNDHLYIDCRRRHLTQLPKGIPTLVQTLLLDDNYIELKDDMFKDYRILQTLSLANNRIRKLPNKLFSGLNNLKVLMLTSNDLDYIENVELEGKALGRLLTMDLSHNRQMELPVKMVEKMRSLRLLNVSYNQITNVRFNYAFKNTPSLRSIDLTGNKLLWLRDSPFHIASTWYDQASIGGISLNFTDCNIMSIGKNTFNDFHTIKTLTLSGNRIYDKVEIRDVMKDLEKSRIQELYMSRMMISDMTPFKNVNLLYLTDLDLSNNTISSMADAFTMIQYIQTLDMSGNRLKTLDGIEDLVNVVKLEASANHLATLATDRTANLTKLAEVDLHGNEISELNGSLLYNAANIRKLDLSWNRIADLDALRFLGKLEILRITHNQVTNISALKSISTLKSVDMTFNYIKSIMKFTFTNDYQLSFLNLSDNHIESIERNSFGEHSPVVLDLSRNRLRELHNTGLVDSKRVYLRNNRIEKLDADTFQTAKSMLLLDLAENRIRFLNSSLNSLTKLSYLDLSQNPMEKYLNSVGNGQNEIAHLQSMRVLGLAGTGLKVVKVKLLQSMPRLSQLDISKNNIITLHPSLLIRQLQLQFLNLSNNRLESVSRKSFEKLPRLQVLDISNNPLHCTCELLRFIRWTFKNNVTIMNMDKEQLYRCVWPQAWTDLPMAELHFHMDNCLEDGDKIIVYIAVAFLVILVGLAIILTCYFIKCCLQPAPSKRRDSYDELDGEDNETSWV